MNSEMKEGMEMMLDHMRADYCGWSRSGNRDISEEIISASEKRYCDGLHYTVGSKYIKACVFIFLTLLESFVEIG